MCAQLLAVNEEGQRGIMPSHTELLRNHSVLEDCSKYGAIVSIIIMAIPDSVLSSYKQFPSFFHLKLKTAF